MESKHSMMARYNPIFELASTVFFVRAEEEEIRVTSFSPANNVEMIFRMLSGKWKIQILWHLSQKVARYGELRRLIVGVTEKVLIRQLRELEEAGLVLRTDFTTLPPRVEYSLAALGISVLPLLDDICMWSKKNFVGDIQRSSQPEPREEEK